MALVPDGNGSLCRYGAVDLDLPRDGESLEELLELVASLQQAAACGHTLLIPLAISARIVPGSSAGGRQLPPLRLTM